MNAVSSLCVHFQLSSPHHLEKERGRKCMQDRLLIPRDKVMVWEFSLPSSSVPVLLHTPLLGFARPWGTNSTNRKSH